MSRYRDLYQASLDDPAGFWREAAREVSWTRAPQQILDDTRPPFYRWLPDAEPYAELLQITSCFAGALCGLGVSKHAAW